MTEHQFPRPPFRPATPAAPGAPAGPGASVPPGVPPGPGVRPPFIAAPVEGRQGRTWLSIGIVGGLLAAGCVVCGIAGAALVALSGQALNEQAQSAVDDYLSAVVDQEWSEAYEARCTRDRRAESLEEFTRRVAQPPQITAYDIGEVRLDDPSGETVLVPVDVAYANGGEAMLTVPLVQNLETGEFEVCGPVTGA